MRVMRPTNCRKSYWITKEVMRSRKSKKNRKYNDEKKMNKRQTIVDKTLQKKTND
jgi:hypothetical protein